MKLSTSSGDFFLDFEHDSRNGYSQAFLYENPLGDPIAHVFSSVYYTDVFSRKGGRRACMEKLLDAEKGPFAGIENKVFRSELWAAYWERMPQDLDS